MYPTSAEKFAAWFNGKYPGAPRHITAEDVEDLKACELIHRYEYYSPSQDGKIVMGILKYEQMKDRRNLKKQVITKYKMCGEPLPQELEGKGGRPKEYSPKCSVLRDRERQRKLRQKRGFS